MENFKLERTLSLIPSRWERRQLKTESFIIFNPMPKTHNSQPKTKKANRHQFICKASLEFIYKFCYFSASLYSEQK